VSETNWRRPTCNRHYRKTISQQELLRLQHCTGLRGPIPFLCVCSSQRRGKRILRCLFSDLDYTHLSVVFSISTCFFPDIFQESRDFSPNKITFATAPDRHFFTDLQRLFHASSRFNSSTTNRHTIKLPPKHYSKSTPRRSDTTRLIFDARADPLRQTLKELRPPRRSTAPMNSGEKMYAKNE
jgi:hypothetical protein